MVVPGPANPAQKMSLLEAIAAATPAFGDLVKDSSNDYLKSKYLALPGLLKAIKPVLLEFGVVIYSQLLRDDSAFVVRTTIAFVDGTEEMASDFPIPDITNMQRIGAAVTYGVRYNLFALLTISPDSDDDGNADGAFALPGAAAAALPGLPPPAQFPQSAPPMQSWPMVTPAMQPMGYPQAMPGATPINPVQPFPVLQ